MLLGCMLPGFGQKPAELAEKGSEAQKINDYFSAAQYYAEALKKDSSNIGWWYQYAEASRLSRNYSAAEGAYRRVTEKDNGKSYPWALFYLGETKKIQGKYKEATKIFEKTQRRFQKKYPPIGLASKRGIEDCTFALEALKNPAELSVKRVDTNVNSQSSDLAPLSRRGLLYFSSTHPASGKNQMKTWQEDTKEGSKFLESDSSLHFSSLTFSRDGRYSICSACKEESHRLRCQLATCKISAGGRIDSLIFFNDPINKKENTQTHPCLGFIGETEFLFFSSDRAGGFGGMDIWY